MKSIPAAMVFGGGEGGGSGSGSYTDLTHKPSINDVELSGNKTAGDLGLANIDDTASSTGSTYSSSKVDDLLDDKADKSTTYTKTEVDDLIPDISGKADKSTTYTKTEVDDLIPDISGKADKSTTYTKTEVDGLLDDKADSADVYTKTEVNDLLDDKADSTDVYTKTETDDLLDAKQNKVIETTLADFDDAVADAEDGDFITVKDASGGYDLMSKTVTLPNNIISSGDDLNDYINVGEYYNAYSAVTSTLLNCPISTGGFRLTVENLYTKEPTQTLESYSGQIYKRVYSNNTSAWLGWVKIATEKDNHTICGHHDANVELTIPSAFYENNNPKGGMISIRGDGNNNYFLGFFVNQALQIIYSNGVYDNDISYDNNTNVLTLPTSGYYYYIITR